MLGQNIDAMRRKASAVAMLAKNISRSEARRNVGKSETASQEVMPGKSSGEVMLTLTRQEGKTKRVR